MIFTCVIRHRIHGPIEQRLEALSVPDAWQWIAKTMLARRWRWGDVTEVAVLDRLTFGPQLDWIGSGP